MRIIIQLDSIIVICLFHTRVNYEVDINIWEINKAPHMRINIADFYLH